MNLLRIKLFLLPEKIRVRYFVFGIVLEFVFFGSNVNEGMVSESVVLNGYCFSSY